MIQGSLFQTLDPKYQPYINLISLLLKWKVINVDFKKHTVSGTNALLGNMPTIPGHWIALAVTSLNLEYIEVIPTSRRTHAIGR